MRLLVGSLLISSAIACSSVKRSEPAKPTGLEVVCTAVLYPTLMLRVRDGDDKPAAIGATVQVKKSGGRNKLVEPEQSYADPQNIAVYGGGTGLLDVYISKPYHTTAAILGLRVKSRPCGVVTAYASATLNLVPDAPAVRQVVLPRNTFNYDAGLSEHLTASVEAAEGVSHAVTWYSRDSSVARISPDGTLTAVCRHTRGKTWIVAASVIAPAVKDSIRVEVWPGDQPACRSPVDTGELHRAPPDSIYAAM
jgi:hypothetical protein